uniref:Uncharacterized protein n=1 Tax=Panagrolaimus davidi TaxID=227884 RepID=A0A914QCW4_9BILA
MKPVTLEQHEEAKAEKLAKTAAQLDIENSNDLKTLIRDMHARLWKLEGEKYDMEKLHEKQLYHLTMLNSYEKWYNGTPAKIPLHSKYVRQNDRRNFAERRTIFDKKNASPCFPNVPPPQTILDFKPKKEVENDY